MDFYTFDASAGEAIVFGATETTSSPLSLHLELLDPGNETLIDVSDSVGTGGEVLNISATGTYTIRVRDIGANTGSYNLTMVKVGGPQTGTGDDGAVQSGEMKSGNLDRGDIDIFRIEGMEGGTLIVRVGETVGFNAEPTFTVHSPTGALLSSGGGTTNATREVTDLPMTGTYYVVLHDTDFDDAGTYDITLATTGSIQVVDADSKPILSGTRYLGSVSTGDIDIYTIHVPEVSALIWSLGEVSSSDDQAPELLVAKPDGSVLFNETHFETVLGHATDLPSGKYTFFVYGLGNVVNYAFTAIEPTTVQIEDADSKVVQSGVQNTGTFQRGDLDVYSIDVPQGGMIAVVANHLSENSPDLNYLIFAPTGFPLYASGFDNSYINSGFNAGRYTVVTYEKGVGQSYAITIATTTNSPFVDADSLIVTDEESHSGTLPLGDLDLYTFPAQAGETIHVFTTVANSLEGPEINARLFDPNGLPLGGSSIGAGASIFAQATVTGNYIIVMAERNADQVSNYILTIYKYPRDVVADADSGPVVSGEYRSGQIWIYDFDAYTIEAHAGGSLMIQLAESPESIMYMKWAVISPMGQLLSTGNDSDGARILVEDLPANGTYTLVITDRGATRTGYYGLTMVAIDGDTEQLVDSDSGPLDVGSARSGHMQGGDLDVYTVDLPATRDAMLLYGPSSTLEAVIFDPTGNVIEISNGFFTTSGAGLYTIVLGETNLSSTSSYQISLIFSHAPLASPTSIQQAAYIRGDVIDDEIDVYSIHANEGSSLFITLNESEYLGPLNGCDPAIAILTPSNTLLYGSSTPTSSGLVITSDELYETGQYTILVFESDADETLVYGLTAMSLSADPVLSGDSGPLTSGITRRGRLDYGDFDVFEFDASVGENFKASLGDLDAGALQVMLMLVAPDGTALNSNFGTQGINIIASDLPQSGTYKLIVVDPFGTATGDYAITAIVSGDPLQPSSDSGLLPNGQSRIGTLLPGDIDFYFADAIQGHPITIQVGETIENSQFSMRVFVYSPDDQLLSNELVTSSSIITPDVPASGMYAIHLVSENGNAGSYAISLNTALGSDTSGPTFETAEYRFDAARPRVVIDASEPLNSSFTLGDIHLTNLTTGLVIDPLSLSLNVTSTGRGFLSMANAADVLPNGNYRLTINAGSVTDASGNPSTTNFQSEFFVLAGDVNRDRVVNFNDLLAVSQNYGRIGRSFSQGNFNYSGSGQVDFNDLLIIAQRYNTSLPAARAPFASGTRIGIDVLEIGQRCLRKHGSVTDRIV